MQRPRLRPLQSATAVIAVLWAIGTAHATHGRFLRDADPRGENTRVYRYGNDEPRRFDRPVVDTTKSIDAGMIRFDTDTFLRVPDATRAGIAIAGGFFMNPGVDVKPDFKLAWVQTVRATRTGENAWGLDPTRNSGVFPDTQTTLSPAYPFTSPPANNTGQTPTIGFQDFPNRRFADGVQFWQAELGLVCIADEAKVPLRRGVVAREVRVIGTFNYGFTIEGVSPPTSPPGIQNVHPYSGPAGWGPATGQFVNTLNNFFSGNPVGGGAAAGNGGRRPSVTGAPFSFSNNDNCFRNVPEPASVALVLLPLLARVMLRRRP